MKLKESIENLFNQKGNELWNIIKAVQSLFSFTTLASI